MSEKKSVVYKGKGYILKRANKEYIYQNNTKKKIYIEKKKNNIFNKFKPVILPLLNQNNKIRNNDTLKNDINLLNESEINSYLLRNKAFRLTWSCIIEKIQKEINIEISKNLNNVFEEIYLYSISNNEYLPLILVTSGTNVADHEIIIDTLSYELKKWNYKKRTESDHDMSIMDVLNEKKKKKKISLNNDDENEKENNVLINKLNNKSENKYLNNDISDDNDIYVCSINSSTSNNINLAIYNIYDQLYKEYKMRSTTKKKYKKSISKGIYSNDSRNNVRRNNSNSCNITKNENNVSSIYVHKEVIDDYSLNRKMVSIDKLIELYKNMSEINKKEEEEEENSDYDNDLSSIYEEIKRNNENSLDNYGKLGLYNKQNNYFSDGRKKVRIIILIHDCEYFNINILNGILNVLINLRIDNKLCLSVILGVSTPSFFFNRITTPDTQSKLRIKTVDILNNKLICENICNSLLFENILPFIISFRTMHTIKLLLHKNNQSISHLIHILYILTKEFYDNNMFSFLSLPMNYYLSVYENCDNEEIITDYSPYTFVRSHKKSFSNYSKYDIRKLHKKIISLCYSANLYYRHLSYIKKKYSSILVENYFNLHGKDSIIHTPTNSDNDYEDFTLKKNSVKYQKQSKKDKDDFLKNNEKNFKNCYINTNNMRYEKENEKSNLSILKSRSSILNKNEVLSNINSSNYKNRKISEPTKEKRKLSNNYSVKGSAVQEMEYKIINNGYIKERESVNTMKSEYKNNENNMIKGQVHEIKKEIKENIKKKDDFFDRNLYAWQFKANTINWWFDHPFKDLVYFYENFKLKNNLKNEINKLLDMEGKGTNNLHDINNVKEINKNLCEVSLSISILQLIERKYAFNIAINLINIIIKSKSEYNNSLKRTEYFRKLFENYEKIKWHENKNILYIEEIYKIVENDIKKCINFLIDIITPYYFKNQEVLLEILKEFKKYYTKIYAIVYNLEDYLYLLKEKEKEKDKENFMNDDFSKNYSSYSVSFSIYYSLFFKLDDLIEMLRKYINKKNHFSLSQNNNSKNNSEKKKMNINSEFNEFTEYESTSEDEREHEKERDNEKLKGKKKEKKNKKAYKRYLTIENSTLKKELCENKEINFGDISDCMNLFIHDYLYLLLLPPVYYHPLAYELIIHKPDKDFTDIMTRDIKSELLSTLCYTNPYKTGNLMCSCCFSSENPTDSDFNTNIVCDNKIYLNPYYDNISTLEDLVNIYRIYERCNKTIDLYNFFISFLNIKIDKFLGYSIENGEEKNNPKDNDDNNLCTEMLQEYYLKFIIAISAFCSFFKILKPPNVSALLNYDDKENYTSNNSDSNVTENSEESIIKFLSDIKKSLQGCTSKKLLFGKLYYNQTIISREFYLQKMIQHNSEYKREIHCSEDMKRRKKKT
ncbi:conserved Plasmodium protein, unknown function [Plasmodium relictum]|uniref:Origin recognition complex subunit 3 N-terminal domain-containing protein n=1 Tax=Plasmodium relictum TaxID=85471 RepID=A0A1J1H2K0_PLARL|nr:conserved Plasmodium protein, unknown function [Plasmodium relictum]CRG99161.1 conserved Plasmodium protein, unknown function [Plasmodium relictum]